MSVHFHAASPFHCGRRLTIQNAASRRCLTSITRHFWCLGMEPYSLSACCRLTHTCYIHSKTLAALEYCAISSVHFSYPLFVSSCLCCLCRFSFPPQREHFDMFVIFASSCTKPNPRAVRPWQPSINASFSRQRFCGKDGVKLRCRPCDRPAERSPGRAVARRCGRGGGLAGGGAFARPGGRPAGRSPSRRSPGRTIARPAIAWPGGRQAGDRLAGRSPGQQQQRYSFHLRLRLLKGMPKQKTICLGMEP
jgi:hypothetical protein